MLILSNLNLQFLAAKRESTLSIAYVELSEEIAWYLNYGRKADEAAGLSSDQEKDVAAFRKAGLRKFYRAYDWPFLKPVVSIDAWKEANGTVSSMSGSRLIATTTPFFASMVGKLCKFTTSGVSWTIDQYISTSEITLKHDPTALPDGKDVSAESGKFTIATDGAYRLPGNFGGIIGDVTFQDGEGRYATLDIASETQLRAWIQGSTSASRPRFAAIRPIDVTLDPSIGQRFDLLLYPIPDTDYPLFFQMHVLPDALTNAANYPYGGMAHAETMKAACLAAAEIGVRSARGTQNDEYDRLLSDSINHERRANVPEKLGYNADWSDVSYASRAYPWRSAGLVTITTGGVTYPS